MPARAAGTNRLRAIPPRRRPRGRLRCRPERGPPVRTGCPGAPRPPPPDPGPTRPAPRRSRTDLRRPGRRWAARPRAGRPRRSTGCGRCWCSGQCGAGPLALPLLPGERREQAGSGQGNGPGLHTCWYVLRSIGWGSGKPHRMRVSEYGARFLDRRHQGRLSYTVGAVPARRLGMERGKWSMSRRSTPIQESTPPGRSSAGKKLVFTAVAVVIFFALLEGALAVVGVEPRAYESDPYVGFSGYAPLFEERKALDGTAVMVRSSAKSSLFNLQRFPRVKPKGATRIFCVGGSTTYGRPYGDVTSFCGWLRRVPRRCSSPSREFRGDQRRRHQLRQLPGGGADGGADHATSPDLFVIYSGHNEFLERRTYPQIIATPTAGPRAGRRGLEPHPHLGRAGTGAECGQKRRWRQAPRKGRTCSVPRS